MSLRINSAQIATWLKEKKNRKLQEGHKPLLLGSELANLTTFFVEGCDVPFAGAALAVTTKLWMSTYIHFIKKKKRNLSAQSLLRRQKRAGPQMD